MSRSIALVMSLAVLLLTSSAASSQFSRPELAVNLLPDASAFGEDWFEVGEPITEAVNPAWEQAATVVYASSTGGRISVAIRYVVQDRDSILVAEEVLDSLRFDYEYSILADTNKIENPLSACDQSVAVEGTNGFWTTIGFGSCALGLDVVLWVETAGTVNGLSGAEAAAMVIQVIISQSDQIGTPPA